MKHLLFISLLFISCLPLRAQMPVSKEPRHKVVFENSKVRVLNVTLPPGDTTFYHIHSTPSAFIFFTRTNTASQLINQQPTSGYSVAGNIFFEDLYTHKRIHRVWNIDTATFHVMDVEILNKDSGFISNAVTGKGVNLLFTQPAVRGYKLELDESTGVILPGNTSSFLLVALHSSLIKFAHGNKVENRQLNEGGFIWISPTEKANISNANKDSASFALLELK